MAKKFNYGKILVVVLLTCLIWIWADLAQDEDFSIRGVTISVATSTNPALLVSFSGESSVSIEEIVLKGPPPRITKLKRKLKEGKRLEIDFDAAQENMDEPGNYTLALLPFLKKDKAIKGLGLTVESCKPQKLAVNVVKLVKKSLDVRCEDEDQNPVKTNTIEPPKVDMFVPANWEGEKLIATVRLTRREIEQARASAVEKTPYIRLPDGQTREAVMMVKITTPQEEDQLEDYLVTATLGIALSPTLHGKYQVELTNPDAVMSAITIRATTEAKRAYENMLYQVILEIDDEDVKAAEPRRELVYNFPPEYVRSGEIELNQQPVTARFKLTPLPSAQTP